jgi:hypothetical protein
MVTQQASQTQIVGRSCRLWATGKLQQQVRAKSQLTATTAAYVPDGTTGGGGGEVR